MVKLIKILYLGKRNLEDLLEDYSLYYYVIYYFWKKKKVYKNISYGFLIDFLDFFYLGMEFLLILLSF